MSIGPKAKVAEMNRKQRRAAGLQDSAALSNQNAYRILTNTLFILDNSQYTGAKTGALVTEAYEFLAALRSGLPKPPDAPADDATPPSEEPAPEAPVEETTTEAPSAQTTETPAQ